MNTYIFFFLAINLRRMENIVDDVEDERQTKGNPAEKEYWKESGGRDGMMISIFMMVIVDSDGVSS